MRHTARRSLEIRSSDGQVNTTERRFTVAPLGSSNGTGTEAADTDRRSTNVKTSGLYLFDQNPNDPNQFVFEGSIDVFE